MAGISASNSMPADITWADEVEGGESLPETTRSVNNKGIITVIEWRWADADKQKKLKVKLANDNVSKCCFSQMEGKDPFRSRNETQDIWKRIELKF